MFEDIRNVLAWGEKPMRIPDAREHNARTTYIRAVWQRVGGVWKTNKQEEVANTLGISYSTLKRYMTKEGSCPYLVQFGMESLAGMGTTGSIYRVEGSGKFCQSLMPFGASRSSNFVTYIALTPTEPIELNNIAKRHSLEILISPYST